MDYGLYLNCMYVHRVDTFSFLGSLFMVVCMSPLECSSFPKSTP